MEAQTMTFNTIQIRLARPDDQPTLLRLAALDSAPAPRGEVLVAKGEAEDHRTALDRAEEKLRKQVEKVSARPRRTRPSQAEPL